MAIRILSKLDLETDRNCVWNAYVELLAMERYENLSPEQRAAHLVFWYESEVQNGGHLQYFENRGSEHLTETIASLGILGAKCQQDVLRDACRILFARDRPHIQSVEEFCDAAIQGQFELYDAQFHECAPSLVEVLDAHLRKRQSSYVLIR